MGEDIEIVGYSDKTTKTIVTGINLIFKIILNFKFLSKNIGLETFRKSLEIGEAGDNCGILLRGI